jgi:hypothetical protein
MNLEDKVCSLELAMRLNELGVKHDSYFWYGKIIDPLFKRDKDNALFTQCHWEWNEGSSYYKEYSAFIAAELGEILPNRVNTINDDPFNSYCLVIRKFYTVDNERNATNNYIVNYECDTSGITGENACFVRKLTKNIFDPNLANAMAKMLIFLIENNLIKLEGTKNET